MNDDLIKRSDAIKTLCDITNKSDMPEDWHRGISVAISALHRVPSADRPQGEWIKSKAHASLWECSECDWGTQDCYDYNYCPYCGAQMKGVSYGKRL